MFICRLWAETVHGWTSDFEEFETQEAAAEYGRLFCRLQKSDELARDFEIYRKEEKKA